MCWYGFRTDVPACAGVPAGSGVCRCIGSGGRFRKVPVYGGAGSGGRFRKVRQRSGVVCCFASLTGAAM